MSHTPKPINVERLRSLNACHEQVALFKSLFGEDDAPLTVETAVLYADKFNWDFAARTMLNSTALAEYDKVRAPALAEYNKACAPAWAEYKKACAPAWAEYKKACAPALAEYDKACAPAWAEYNKACALTFATLYSNP
jgi:hypothetical protein